MRPLTLALLFCSGCFVVTRATYAGLVKPDRPQLARDLMACTVDGDEGAVSARVALRLEHGPAWFYDDLSAARGSRYSKVQRIDGRRLESGLLGRGNIPCVMVPSDGAIAKDVLAWHFDAGGVREESPSPITLGDLEHAAFAVYQRSLGSRHSPKLYLSVPPPDGRGVPPSFDQDDCIGCQNLASGSAGTELALPGWPSRGGMAGFAFLLPITLGLDVAAWLEATLLCCGFQPCLDAFMKVK